MQQKKTLSGSPVRARWMTTIPAHYWLEALGRPSCDLRVYLHQPMEDRDHNIETLAFDFRWGYIFD